MQVVYFTVRLSGSGGLESCALRSLPSSALGKKKEAHSSCLTPVTQTLRHLPNVR